MVKVRPIRELTIRRDPTHSSTYFHEGCANTIDVGGTDGGGC
jgi:hypothetical protein